MNLRNLLLASMTSNKAVKEVAVKTGLPEKYVRKLMKLAIPVILKHLTKNVSTSAGLIALAAALLVTAIIGWGALYRVNGPRTGCISIRE